MKKEDWQNRQLSDIYPVVFIDAIHYSVRDNGVIRNWRQVYEELSIDYLYRNLK